MHGGELIYQARDQFGAIQVVDYQQQLRCLHFDNSTQQSAMLLRNPDVLTHRYTQAMMLPFMWHPADRVLLLGLGAGSIARYLYHHFPEIRLDAIEIRKAVIDIANEFFLLPQENRQFGIINDDALQWLTRQPETTVYDVILVDMFLTSQKGTDLVTDVTQYLRSLAALLNENGVIVFNHLGDDVKTSQVLQALINGNEGFYLYAVNIDEANTILYASRLPCPGTVPDEIFYAFEKQRCSPYKQYHERLKRLDSSL